MNCNCNNKETSGEQVKIKHVYGNVLRIAIPLTLRTIEKVDEEIVATDTAFFPSSGSPVNVVFSKGAVKTSLIATMDGNIAYVEDKGTIPVGTYAITVVCKDNNGNPYRFKQNAVLQVVDATADAGIETPIEYEVTTWYLDAAIFMALKGEDGVGIDDITTESSTDVGGMNTITITMTNGETRTFTVMNGSGSVDDKLDPTSGHPVANRVVTARFNEMSSELAGLFGNVDYDTTSKSIRFWDKGKTKVLASLDARPFIKDGMVSNVYISNNTLVITFNTDAGREAIGVPLSSVFNPNNYYTKTQFDNRISSVLANYYTKSSIEALLETKADVNGSRYDEFGALEFDLYGQDEPDLLVKASATVDHQDESVTITFSDAYNYGNEKLSYTFDPIHQSTKHIATEEFVEDYVNEHGGGGSIEQVQADWNQTNTLAVDYIKNKPTIPDVSGLATKQEVNAKQDTISDLATIRSGAALGATALQSYTETDPTVPAWAKQSTKPSYTASEVGAVPTTRTVNGKALSSNITLSASDVGALPSDTHIPADQVQSNWNETNTSSKAYIQNKPTIPAAQVNSDWDASSGVAQILNKPTFKTINGQSLVGSGNITVVGEKGDKGDTGSVTVTDGVAQIGIINDLTTGGTGDALSAEMGKRLGGRVDELEDAIEEMEDGAGYDIRIVGQQLVITSRNRPSVNVGEVSNHNVACKAGNTATASFYVSGRKLTSAIQIAVSDATNWQVLPASISPVGGKVALTLVTITYRPAAGTASGTTHNCNVTVSCGGVTYGTIAMQGTVAAAPSITLTPATLNISTASGTPATATVNVKGSALEGDIALAISGTGFTLSQNTVAKADAESAAGADVTVTFDGSAAGTATITATATGATAANVEVNGSVVGRKAAGESWDDSNGMLTYTVLDDTTTVSVKQKSKTTCTGAITIPASVNDDNGIGYRVIMVADNGFNQNTNITSVVMRDGGIEILGSGAFDGCTSLSSMTLPNTLKSIGNPSSSGYQNVIKGTQLTRLALPASLEKIFAYGIAENASLTELEIKGMKANSAGGEIFNHAIKANLVTVYTDIALKNTDDPLSVLPKITLASWGGSFLYGSIDGDSNTWNIYKDGDNNNQKITLVVPDDESVAAYEALRTKSGISNVKGWGFFNIIKKSN